MENTPRSKNIFFDQRVSSFSTGYIEVTLMVRYASTGGDGGSDDDEMPEDVRARRRGKVMAKNQARRAQEQAWENARVAQLTQQTQNAIAKNKNLTAAETEMGKVNPVTPYVPAGNIDRDEEKWLAGKESQRAWANVQAQEQAKQEQKSGNWLSNLWNAGVSAMGSALSLGDGGGLLSVRGGDPNPFTEWWNNTVVPAWDNFVAWLNGEKPVPTSTPDAASTLAVGIAQTMIAQTETARPTSTPTSTMTPFPTITFTPTIAPTIALNGKPLNLKQWTDQAGRTTVEFCGAVLQREAHGAWQDDRWFDGRPDDPAKIFAEAAVRWYWSWIKDTQIRSSPTLNQGGYGHNPDNPADRELMIYNWIVRGMQSEDNINQELLNQYFDELNPNFTQVCNQILYPSNPDWTNGGNMQSWANAYLFTGQGQQIAAQNHLYQYGSGNTAWYILDGPVVKQLESYKIDNGPEYPTDDGGGENDE